MADEQEQQPSRVPSLKFLASKVLAKDTEKPGGNTSARTHTRVHSHRVGVVPSTPIHDWRNYANGRVRYAADNATRAEAEQTPELNRVNNKHFKRVHADTIWKSHVGLDPQYQDMQYLPWIRPRVLNADAVPYIDSQIEEEIRAREPARGYQYAPGQQDVEEDIEIEKNAENLREFNLLPDDRAGQRLVRKIKKRLANNKQNAPKQLHETGGYEDREPFNHERVVDEALKGYSEAFRRGRNNERHRHPWNM